MTITAENITANGADRLPAPPLSDMSGAEQPIRARDAYQAIAAASRDAILIADHRGSIVYANATAGQFFGLDGRLVGTSLTALGFPSDALLLAATSGQSVTGTTRGAPFVITPLTEHAPTGTPLSMAIVIHAPCADNPRIAIVRARRDREPPSPQASTGKSREENKPFGPSETQLLLAIEATGLGVCHIDAANPDRFEWSPRTREIWGVGAEEEITPTLVESLVHPEDRAGVNVALQHALDPTGDGSFFAEHRICRRDGSTGFVVTWGKFAFVGDGPARRPGLMTGFVLDVTERKAAEVERRRLQEQIELDRALLTAVLEQMPAGVTIAEAPSGRVLMRNAEAERCGFAPGGDVRALHANGEPYAPDDYPLARTLRNGRQIVNEEITVAGPDGEQRVLSVNTSPVIDSSGQECAVVVVDHDVTESRRHEAVMIGHVLRERALASLSDAALSGEDLHLLFGRTADVIRNTLDVDLSIVAETEPNGCCCIVKAASGWPEPLEGRELPCPAGTPTGADVMCGDHPTVFTNVSDMRILGIGLLSKYSIASGLVVPAKGFDHPFGTLAAFSRASRKFTEAEVDFVSSAANIMALAIERKRREALESNRSAALINTLHALAERPGLKSILVNVLTHLKNLLDCQSLGLWLYDSRAHSMTLHLTCTRLGEIRDSDPDHPAASGPVSVEHLPAWPLLRSSSEPHSIDVVKQPDMPFREWYLRQGITGCLIMPMRLDETIGWIVARCDHRSRHSPEQLAIAQALAQQAALAVYMERLAERGRSTAVLNERNRMAREIHDTLSQGFAGIAFQLEAAGLALGRNAEVTRSCIEGARDLARQNLAEARRSVWSLRPTVHGDGGLPQAFRTAIDSVTRGAAITVRFNAHGTPRMLPDEVENDVLRIGIEAVTNALKHSNSASIDVILTFGHRRLWLVVADDGSGFDMEQVSPGSFGITSMRERADRIGATLDLRAAPGKGTCVKLTFVFPRQIEEAN